MIEKPKLLLVADTYYPKVDGILRFMEEFIKRSRKDFEITLLVPNYSQRRIKDIQTVFFEVSRYLRLSGYSSIKLLSLGNFQKMKEAIKAADLVFVQGPSLASYLAIYLARHYKKKTAAYVHVVSWDLFEKFFPRSISMVIRRMFIKAYNKCKLIVIPYRELEEVMQAAGVKTEMQVARLGIDINRFIPAKNKQESKIKMKLPADHIIIGYVGRISREKNTQVLLDAFNKLDQRKFYLLIVGDGQPDIIEKFKQNRNCHITGFVYNVEDYLQATDIFVLPSTVETTSLATLEAMSCGLPVVVTKVGFMKEYISKNHNGLFFPRENPTLLALKLEKLSCNAELRKRLGDNARKTIAYSFSWERSVNKIKKILSQFYYGQ